MLSDAKGRFADPMVGRVLACSRELLPVMDVDTLLRSALELARSRLGVDRCALWLLEPDGRRFRGTWGTAMDGTITDERDRFCPIEEVERDLPCPFAELEGWVIRSDPRRLTWTSQGHRQEGRGWNTIIPVIGPKGNAGLFFQDSAIEEKPIDPDHQDLVALYCALLGQIAGMRQIGSDASESDLQRMLELAEELLSCSSSDELHRRLAELSCELMGAEKTSLYLEDPRSDAPSCTWTAFRDGSVLRRWSQMEGCEFLDRIPEPVMLAHPRHRWLVDVPDLPMRTNRSMWVHVLSANGRRKGTLLSEGPALPPPRILERFSTFASLASRILERIESVPHSSGRERSEFLDLVAGGIAHDFNNLLAAALGNIELLLEVPDLDRARVRQRLEDARSACLRGKSLASQLLTVTRGGTPVLRPIDPVPFLLEGVKSSSTRSGLRWSLRSSDAAWSVLADEAQLGQVVQNLVVNACQWQGTDPELEITVTNRTISEAEAHPLGSGRFVQLDFQDRGPGIPDSLRGRIFDPYFSTRREGSGLGLATCRTILGRHHGSIECIPCSSGALFRLLIPATDESLPRPAQPEVHSMSGLSGRRILVMDDEPSLREMVRDILESQGMVVETVAEGRIAVDRWREAAHQGIPYDAGLFDLSVAGGLGGAEAARRILSDHPGARIVVCSGYADDPILTSSPGLGFAGALAKPFRMADLLDTLEQAVHHGIA